MNVAYSIEQAREDLLERARAYFVKKVNSLQRDRKDIPAGFVSWLYDFEMLERQKIVERGLRANPPRAETSVQRETEHISV